jgi:hypothetical protein
MRISLNWGTGIVFSYAAFAVATMAFVVFALRRPVDLVAADYYAQSLRQDQQMDAVRNARDLGAGAAIEQTGDRSVVVSIPRAQAAAARGTITLYRASDASADQVVDLRTDAAGRQEISLGGLKPGAWSVHVRWSAGDRNFYLEQRVFAR